MRENKSKHRQCRLIEHSLVGYAMPILQPKWYVKNIEDVSIVGHLALMEEVKQGVIAVLLTVSAINGLICVICKNN